MSILTRPEQLEPATMDEVVGYPAIACTHQSMADEFLVAKHNRLFLLVDEHGDVQPPGSCGLGLFHDDTRILSHYQLGFSVGPVSLLSSRASSMYALQIDLALSDRDFGGNSWDPKNSIHIRRELVVGDRLIERVTLTSFLNEPVELGVRLSLGCDFADIFEVRGWLRERRGQFYRPVTEDDAICFAYRGLDGELVRSQVHFATAPDELRAGGAEWVLGLRPNEPQVLVWEVRPDPVIDQEPPPPDERLGLGPMQAVYAEWEAECTSWGTDVEEFNVVLDRARADLRGLYFDVDGEAVIAAGIPWYSTIFGRDSILTSLQALPLSPRIARDTLRYLARHQGERDDPFTEEQPGKIMHELRRGELARAREIPHLPYYGTVDATPLWLVLLHETWRWTGDDALASELLPNAKRALDWIDRYGDLDGDGFIEYARTSEKGLVNQGWKDSGDGVPFPDGSLPRPPIALVEVQGYVYDAWIRMAQLFAALGDGERALWLQKKAAALRRRIHERFWLDELGTFALALDGRKEPLPTATSNAGHLLWSRVTTPEQARRLAEHFLSPQMFSGWGVRTLSAGHRVYNPMSYHNGSVWPHDNAILALGLALNGQTPAMLPILTALHEVACSLKDRRLPELFCGMARNGSSLPVQYPVSCVPQAWAAGALFMILQAATGILPDAPSGFLHIREPQLPPFLRELRVSGLQVGRSRVWLEFVRQESRTVAKLLDVQGEPLHVVIELT